MARLDDLQEKYKMRRLDGPAADDELRESEEKRLTDSVPRSVSSFIITLLVLLVGILIACVPTSRCVCISP